MLMRPTRHGRREQESARRLTRHLNKKCAPVQGDERDGLILSRGGAKECVRGTSTCVCTPVCVGSASSSLYPQNRSVGGETGRLGHCTSSRHPNVIGKHSTLLLTDLHELTSSSILNIKKKKRPRLLFCVCLFAEISSNDGAFMEQ